MKVGGLIPWNVTPNCETSQIYYLMGSRPMKDVLGNHLKDLLFLLAGSVTHPSIWKESFTWIVLRIRFVRGRIWKGDVLIADLEELETMDASEIYSKRLNAKEVIFPKQGEFIFPIADGRIKTPGVQSTSSTTENGYENCIYSMNNINMSNEDNNHDTNYIKPRHAQAAPVSTARRARSLRCTPLDVVSHAPHWLKMFLSLHPIRMPSMSVSP